MEIWELRYFIFHIYQVTPTHFNGNSITQGRETGCLFITEPRGKARKAHHSQAKLIHLGRPEHVWPTEHTEMEGKYETQVFNITLEEVSH